MGCCFTGMALHDPVYDVNQAIGGVGHGGLGALSCRIVGGEHKHRTVMTVHAGVACHQSKPEQGTEPIPEWRIEKHKSWNTRNMGNSSG
jgi:hypothetical protein